MDARQAFSLANSVALLAWMSLMVFQRRRWARDIVIPGVVLSFALMYAAVIAVRWSGSSGGFGSLDAVSQLFSDPWLLLAGWVHYLAFDLLVGRWEAADAASRGIPPLLVVPFLLLTFMFGPAGWLAYMAVRSPLAGMVQKRNRSFMSARAVQRG